MSKKHESEKPQETEGTTPADVVVDDSSNLPALPEDNRPPEEQLAECEDIIHAKTDDFIDVVINLKKIKEGKLFECRNVDKKNPQYSGFEDYMEKEFGFKRAYYSRLKKAYDTYQDVTEKLGSEQAKKLPSYPGFFLSLNEIKPAKQIEVLQEVLGKKEGQIKGTDIIDCGKEKKVLIKKQPKPSSAEQDARNFSRIVKKLANEDANGIISNMKKPEDLVDMLNKILAKLQKGKATK